MLRGQQCGGEGTIIRKLDENIVGADEPAPAVAGDLGSGRYIAVYDGDRVSTAYCVDASGGSTLAGCPDPAAGTKARSEPRLVRNAPAPPLSGQPVDAVVYTASVDHRAVRGTDGQCYREFWSGDTWRRSGAYGATDEACRRAAWNAYDRNRRAPMRMIHEAPPDGHPPQPEIDAPGGGPSVVPAESP